MDTRNVQGELNPFISEAIGINLLKYAETMKLQAVASKWRLVCWSYPRDSHCGCGEGGSGVDSGVVAGVGSGVVSGVVSGVEEG